MYLYVYTVYIRYFKQGNHHTYGHIRCVCTVLANPINGRTIVLDAIMVAISWLKSCLSCMQFYGNFQRNCTTCHSLLFPVVTGSEGAALGAHSA
jgi:hypothetical protein